VLFVDRDKESTRKIRERMASGTDHLILKKLHIPTQDNLIGQKRIFAAFAAKQRKS
jgi:hypothetical protein